MPAPDKDEFWAELKAAGEEKVRTSLTLNRYIGYKQSLAYAWLESKERERSAVALKERTDIARSEEFAKEARDQSYLSSEANTIARAAYTIANKTNDEAKKANRLAKYAIGLSVIAILFSVIISLILLIDLF